MGYEKYKDLEFRYVYDFAVDGGAASTIDLTASGNALEAGLVITDMHLYIDTAFTSAGTPTVTLGNEDDVNGYFADILALGAAGAVIRAGSVAGDLIWDDTNDHRIDYKLPDAGAAVPSVTIGTAALTAGKITMVVKCRRYA